VSRGSEQLQKLEGLREKVKPVLDGVDQKLVKRDHVALAWRFTTQTVTKDLEDIRTTLRGSSAPAKSEFALAAASDLTAVFGAGRDFAKVVEAVHVGTFDAPEYRGTDGAFATPPSPRPQLNSVRVAVILPRRAGDSLNKPSPVTLFQHDLAGKWQDVLDLALPLAQAGQAVVAMELPLHGTRMAGAQAFVNINDWRATRDNVRQSVVELLQLVRILADPEAKLLVPGAGGTDLRGRLAVDPISFVGAGLGGGLGIILAALEPDVDVLVVNAAGGGLARGFGATGEVAGTIQWLIDRADPLHFARYVRFEKLASVSSRVPTRLLVQRVEGDAKVAADLTSALAEALGVSTGASTFRGTAGTVACHPMLTCACPCDGLTAPSVEARAAQGAMQAQAVTFIASGGVDVVPAP